MYSCVSGYYTEITTMCFPLITIALVFSLHILTHVFLAFYYLNEANANTKLLPGYYLSNYHYITL